ncbi:MAG TPA: YggT family protein [Anaerolineales bacterium]|nr:YggT family protein [Anaerolineales bacterium]
MTGNFLVDFILIITRFFFYLVLAYVLLSFFLPPYHPAREALGRILNPLLEPIRSVMPRMGMFDFSPLILIIAVEVLSRLLISILLST